MRIKNFSFNVPKNSIAWNNSNNYGALLTLYYIFDVCNVEVARMFKVCAF